MVIRQEHRAGEKLFRQLRQRTDGAGDRPSHRRVPADAGVCCRARHFQLHRRRSHPLTEAIGLAELPRPLLRLPRRGAGDRYEIYNWLRQKKDKDGQVSDAEESFQGLMFTLSTPDDLRPWLSLLLSEVRYKTGAVKHLAVSCPGKADSFNHASSTGDYIPCVSAARNALGKMGVFFA